MKEPDRSPRPWLSHQPSIPGSLRRETRAVNGCKPKTNSLRRFALYFYGDTQESADFAATASSFPVLNEERRGWREWNETERNGKANTLIQGWMSSPLTLHPPPTFNNSTFENLKHFGTWVACEGRKYHGVSGRIKTLAFTCARN